jgi:hypothetical protein
MSNPNNLSMDFLFTKKIKNVALLAIFCLLPIFGKAQLNTQTIHGIVVDRSSRHSLPGVHVMIRESSPSRATVTDHNGRFAFNDVPVGRYQIQVSYIGYHTLLVPDVGVESGKATLLEIPLEESVTSLEGVEVRAKSIKDEAQNPMAFVSARSFSVDEARRYAGGFDDPARIASAFAGVGTGGPGDNAMSIRGNAPKGVLWRVEGVEVPNPNHFAGANVAGGGFISVLSANVLGNSDFFTGAFPAEYGNALSGVFDMKFRNGSTHSRNFGVQVGVIGLDLFAEGPFVEGKEASYLVNYRYSTFGLIQHVLPDMSGLPQYQDLTFKFHFPTKKAGEFSFWGLGALDKVIPKEDFTPDDWKYAEERLVMPFRQNMGASGVSHKFHVNRATYVNSTLAVSGTLTQFEINQFNGSGDLRDSLDHYFGNSRFTFTSYVHHKFGSRHVNRTGFVINRDGYDLRLRGTPTSQAVWNDIAQSSDGVFINQFYTQSKVGLSPQLFFNAGLHSQWFTLNDQFTIEPRLGLNWEFVPSHSFSLGYGNHSRIEPLPIYFADVEGQQPNQDLKLTRAHHVVVGYDKKLGENKRLKIETYYQKLYDVPIIEQTNYSVLNFGQEYAFNGLLQNKGLGRNYGVELTLEKFLENGFYYLLTTSVFDSKFSNDDGNTWYNSRYNFRYIVNALAGKEFAPYRNKNKIVGINLKLTAQATERFHAIDHQSSKENQAVVYDLSQPYAQRGYHTIFFDMTLSQKNNYKNHSTTFGLQVKNILQSANDFAHLYNFRDERVELVRTPVMVPNLFFRVQF